MTVRTIGLAVILACVSAPRAPARCCADLDDGSGTGLADGAVTIDDLLYFLGAFEAGSTHGFCECVHPPPCLNDSGAPVDCCVDQSGAGPLLWFIEAFERGC